MRFAFALCPVKIQKNGILFEAKKSYHKANKTDSVFCWHMVTCIPQYFTP